jgi:FkbH-like protein
MTKEDLQVALNRVTKEPTYSVYTAASNILDHLDHKESQMPILKVVILRNFTVDPLIPVIKGEIALAGFYPVIHLGGYDTIAQEVFDPQSAQYMAQPDLVFVSQWLEVLAPALATRFPSLSSSQVNDEIDRVLNMISQFIAALRQHTNVPIVINNFLLPCHSAFGILDVQSEQYQTNAILRLNLELLRCLKNFRDVYLIDYMSLMARIGSEQGVDERYWQIGRAPVGRNALIPFGQEYGKFVRALSGKARKCLALDCDNVLWGGILGEEGLNNIKLGTAFPGSGYQSFQREILNLHDRGVILALCSKNNEPDVLEVLQNHPDMLLREKNFSTWQINWDDKASNLMRIAQELNIGLDSIVFVDDSQFECDLVRERLPQVAVAHLSSDPLTFSAALNAKAYFDTLVFSEEDKKRNQMYRDQKIRKNLNASAGSIEEYLTSLEMVAQIGQVDDASIARVAQLTQKTNQFNLTTRRYSEGEIRLMQSSGADIFYLKLRDRVSDMGLVGVAIVKYSGQQAEIDIFLLSCRVLGRRVEEAFLAHILYYAKIRRNCRSVLGCYHATKKNQQVADFYGRMGFRLAAKTELKCDWEFALREKDFLTPGCIKVNVVESKEKG